MAVNPPPKEVVTRVPKQSTSVNNVLKPMQYFVREDLQKSDLKMEAAHHNAMDFRKSLPRHGRAPPSVVKRNRELMQSSKNQRKMATQRDNNKTHANSMIQTNGFSRNTAHDQQLLSTFHIVPIAFTTCLNQYMNVE